MRDALLKGIQKLCWLYPQLHVSIKYSDVLSQDDVDVFAAFVNGHVESVIRNFPTDEAEQERQLGVFLKGSTGLSRIDSKDIIFVEAVLAAAAGRDTSISPEQRDLVDYLRSHRNIWWALHGAYEKIVRNNLVNTCPLVVAKQPLLEKILPFGSKMHNFQEFHKLFHETIHYILEDNGICFHDDLLDEGLVTYFHEQVVGKGACYAHYVGEEGERYLKAAKLLEKVLGKYPRNAVVPVLQKKLELD
jgi:hypothetical protein